MKDDVHELETVAQCMTCGTLFGYFRDLDENEVFCDDCRHLDPITPRREADSFKTGYERHANRTLAVEMAANNTAPYR